MTTENTTPSSVQEKLHHDVREPARTVDIVPALKQNYLLSGSNFSDANYVTVLTPTAVLFYDGNYITIQVFSKSILRRCRYKKSGLWRVPLKQRVPPPKSRYIILDKKSENPYQTSMICLPRSRSFDICTDVPYSQQNWHG